ncbi:glutathione S-transferase [Scheffersomyces xylosifermentans]|uniref:glutathione S-transferase n=1 Tax=Scheffersomyces xylosifermentans TaxID=1304137 RepID=UPI00315D5866
MSQPKIILHWLDQSRSHRILWLIEELGLDYDLKIYSRTKAFRAPIELERVHPLGKSPVIEIAYLDGSSKVIAETGHIIAYLLQNFDVNRKLTGKTEFEVEQVDYFLHYSEGTLQPLLVGLFVNDLAVHRAPFGTRTIMHQLTKGINNAYYGSELVKNLNYLENIIREQHSKGSKYFVGSFLTAADIILLFPLRSNLFDNAKRLSASLPGVDFKKDYSHLYQWCVDTMDEPVLVRCNELVTKEESKISASML